MKAKKNLFVAVQSPDMGHKNKQGVNLSISEGVLKSRLEKLKKGKSLRRIQREDFPFASLGTLSRISKGEFPVRKEIRDLFDLTSTQEIAVCPIHGVVHLGSCKLTFAQKLEFSDMSQKDKEGLLEVFQSLSKLSELKELREAASGEPSNHSFARASSPYRKDVSKQLRE